MPVDAIRFAQVRLGWLEEVCAEGHRRREYAASLAMVALGKQVACALDGIWESMNSWLDDRRARLSARKGVELEMRWGRWQWKGLLSEPL